MNEREELLLKLEQLWFSIGDDLIGAEDEISPPPVQDQRRSRALRKLKQGDAIFKQLKTKTFN